MSELSKKMVIGSMVVAGIVALMAIADLITGLPFSGTLTKTMDIVFILCAAILLYLCWTVMQDAK
jgi:hypothetical protein